MNHDPIFKAIFGEQWEHLPPVIHKHYANRPFSSDIVTVQGSMDVYISRFIRLLSPLLYITGALVPYAGKNIPVTVHFLSDQKTNHYIFDRIFHFPGKPPYHFRSRMIPASHGEIIEYMPIGIGWNAHYRFDGQKVLLEHRGYTLKWFSKHIRIPLEWFLGKGYAEEEALSDNQFRMVMSIRHPLIGKVYEYKGLFSITSMELS